MVIVFIQIILKINKLNVKKIIVTGGDGRFAKELRKKKVITNLYSEIAIKYFVFKFHKKILKPLNLITCYI